MINPNWSKWIQRAVLKHFRNNLPDHPVFLETEDVDKNKTDYWIEIRLDIKYDHLQRNQYRVTVPVDILVISAKKSNVYNAKVLTGLVASKFDSIAVKDDLDVVKFCLRVQGRIEDTYYGETEAAANMEQATVEGILESLIIGD